MPNKEIRIYSPPYSHEQSWLKTLVEIFSHLFSHRELIWRLFLKDIKAKYKQSILGPAWVVVMPIATMSTFLLLNMSGVITIRSLPVPYAIYGFLGISLWTFFSQSLSLTTDSINMASALIGKTNIPREVFIITLLCQSILDLTIRLLLVIPIYLFYRLLPHPLIFLFPFYILPLFLFTLGLGFYTAIFNVIFRDTIHIVTIALNFLIFLTPIMYTYPERGILAVANRFNPIFFLIQTPRDIIVTGKIYYPLQFFLSTLLAILIFTTGCITFYRAESFLIEKT